MKKLAVILMLAALAGCNTIAGVGDEHLALLGKIATIFVDADRVAELRTAATPDEVVAIINGTPD
mgnify:CR=1 FL=1